MNLLIEDIKKLINKLETKKIVYHTKLDNVKQTEKTIQNSLKEFSEIIQAINILKKSNYLSECNGIIIPTNCIDNLNKLNTGANIKKIEIKEFKRSLIETMNVIGDNIEDLNKLISSIEQSSL